MVVQARPASEGRAASLHPRLAAVPRRKWSRRRAPSDRPKPISAFAKQQVSLLQAEANLAAAQANLVKAQQDYERLKPLVEQDAAARQDLDAAIAALRAAEVERPRERSQCEAGAAEHRIRK